LPRSGTTQHAEHGQNPLRRPGPDTLIDPSASAAGLLLRSGEVPAAPLGDHSIRSLPSHYPQGAMNRLQIPSLPPSTPRPVLLLIASIAVIPSFGQEVGSEEADSVSNTASRLVRPDNHIFRRESSIRQAHGEIDEQWIVEEWISIRSDAVDEQLFKAARYN